MHTLWTIAVSLLLAGTGALLVLDWLRGCGAPLPCGKRLAATPAGVEVGGRESAALFGLAVLFRLTVALLAALFLLRRGVSGLEGNLNAWMKWDALHYVNLVGLGYAGYTEGGAHLFLVFFPLYVWLLRLVNLLLHNAMLTGMALSTLCYAGGCVYLYRLAALDYGRVVARRAVLFLSVFPYAFFFGGTMTEGLFLLTTAASLYHIRRHRWLAAGLWGMLAALTRMQGLLMVGAALAELIESGRPFALRGPALRRSLRAVLRRLPAVLLPILGTLLYLGLNFWVEGDPFAFVQQQKHWHQGFMWISDTLWYVLGNALSYEPREIQMQIWIPTLLLFIVFLGLLYAARGKHRNMYMLYAFVYLVLNYSLSWLLSAGRYLSCAAPFFLFAAVLTEKRPVLARCFAAGMGVLFAINLSVFLSGGQIM